MPDFREYLICRNKRPGHLIFRSTKENSKTHQKPSFLCTPPFEKSPIKTHRFCVLPPLKNHRPKPIGFVYSPLWKTTVFGGRLHRQIRCSVLCPEFYYLFFNSKINHFLCRSPIDRAAFPGGRRRRRRALFPGLRTASRGNLLKLFLFSTFCLLASGSTCCDHYTPNGKISALYRNTNPIKNKLSSRGKKDKEGRKSFQFHTDIGHDLGSMEFC